MSAADLDAELLDFPQGDSSGGEDED
jgi:hypothetical protein